jgi:heme/copper-type cytochrome/quinol oxidase subunit 2
VDGKNENARGFPFSAYSTVFLQHAVAYVNQIKMPVAREGLIIITTTTIIIIIIIVVIIIIIIIIIIQKRPEGGSATVRGECGVG